MQDHRAAGEQAAAAKTGGGPSARPAAAREHGDLREAGHRDRPVRQAAPRAGCELDGERGFYVLTLLRVDGGKALPVVRGWLPGSADPAKAPAAPTGEVTVTGALQASESPGRTASPPPGVCPQDRPARSARPHW